MRSSAARTLLRARSFSASGRRIVATTFQPLFTNNLAVALPKPDEVPVIKAVLFDPSFVIKYAFKLPNRERQNFITLDGKVIFKGGRASVKSSRHFHGNNYFPFAVL